MPSYAGVKWITSSTVYTYFMGTDFSYAELTGEFYKRFKVKGVDEKDDTYIAEIDLVELIPQWLIMGKPKPKHEKTDTKKDVESKQDDSDWTEDDF